jgi:biotin-(acetyl-CoA carboxylase) ligase
MRDTRLPPLPSVFTPVALREGGDTMARAMALAPAQGAGTLLWFGTAACAEAALVLEPELPLAAARLVLLAGANALADALSHGSPAEIPVQFGWPGKILVNGAACGALALAAPPGVLPAAVPDWLVIGLSVALAPSGVDPAEPGLTPDRTTLAEEGWDAHDGAVLIAAWARHLMAGLDDWQAHGPKRLCETYLARLVAPAGARGIDPAGGDLLLADRRLPLCP